MKKEYNAPSIVSLGGSDEFEPDAMLLAFIAVGAKAAVVSLKKAVATTKVQTYAAVHGATYVTGRFSENR
ncbi:MAG: hypothetical protein ACLKAK_10200 [Alkaliphilus sp.]